MPLSILELTKEQQELTESIVEKLKADLDNDTDNRMKISGIEYISNLLNEEENEFIKWILSLNPVEFGFQGQYIGVIEPPKKIVAVKGQKVQTEKETIEIYPSYVPQDIYEAFKKMDKAIQKDTGKKLILLSGYRSPAYQLYIILYNLKRDDYNLPKTLQRVALPGYSEHGDPKNLALDLTVEKGDIFENEFDFSQTQEYKWLLENAASYGFYLSYPENNSKGVMFEPWHWRYQS